jgi:hypothetical protein
MYVAMLGSESIHCFCGVPLHIDGFRFACVQVLLAPNYRWLDPQKAVPKTTVYERPIQCQKRGFLEHASGWWLALLRPHQLLLLDAA